MFGAAAAQDDTREVELTPRDALLYEACLKRALECSPKIDHTLPSVEDNIKLQVDDYMGRGYGELGLDELVRNHGRSGRNNLKSILTSLWLAAMATENAAKGIQKPTLEEVALSAKQASRREIRIIEDTMRRASNAV
jgi:hypothetical protein